MLGWDSGSAVLDDDLIVGVLLAGSGTTTVTNTLRNVVEALGVEIEISERGSTRYDLKTHIVISEATSVCQ